MRILFACGGTAGHVNPALAVAGLFRRKHPDCEMLFVGADGGMEQALVQRAGYEIRSVTITNFQRSFSPKAIKHNLATLRNLSVSKKQSNAILDAFAPDLAVGTGGYASFPVLQAAAKRGIPTAIHESNAIPGLTTKQLAKVVDVVMVGFPPAQGAYEQPEKLRVTGTPVRGEFFAYSRSEAREKLGIEQDVPMLLSYFGSLGADVMNERMCDVIEQELADGMPFRHVHGAARNYHSMQEALLQRGVDISAQPRITLMEYIHDMPLYMAAADVLICRAGASTISELSALGKPSILIPSPNVTANHQEKNARVLADAGAAVLLTEPQADSKTLYQQAQQLLSDAAARARMRASLLAFSEGDPCERIYDILLACMQKKSDTGGK